MKTRPTRAARALTRLLLLVQLAASAVPLADALLEAGGADGVRIAAPSEREGFGGVHVEGDCVLCQHLAHGVAAEEPAPTAQIFVTTEPDAFGAGSERFHAATLLLERGRSPPTA